MVLVRRPFSRVKRRILPDAEAQQAAAARAQPERPAGIQIDRPDLLVAKRGELVVLNDPPVVHTIQAGIGADQDVALARSVIMQRVLG